MLLAGERETGTLPFLDTLPGTAAQLWLGKFLAGVLLVLRADRPACGPGRVGPSVRGLGRGGRGRCSAWRAPGCRPGLGNAVLGVRPQRHEHDPARAWPARWRGVCRVWPCLAAGGRCIIRCVRYLGREPEPSCWTVLLLLTVPRRPRRLRRLRLHPAGPEPIAAARRRRRPRTGQVRAAWSVLFWLTWRQARGFAGGWALSRCCWASSSSADGVVLWPADDAARGRAVRRDRVRRRAAGAVPLPRRPAVAAGQVLARQGRRPLR